MRLAWTVPPDRSVRSVRDGQAARRFNSTAFSEWKAAALRHRRASDGSVASAVSTPLIAASMCPVLLEIRMQSSVSSSDMSLAGTTSGSFDESVSSHRSDVRLGVCSARRPREA